MGWHRVRLGGVWFRGVCRLGYDFAGLGVVRWNGALAGLSLGGRVSLDDVPPVIQSGPSLGVHPGGTPARELPELGPA